MKKNLLIAAIALTALAGCTSDEYVGDNPNTAQGTSGAINFASKAGKMTRATSNTGNVAQMLDGQFKVFGIKKKNASGEDPVVYTTVFNNYVVWSNTTNVTTSNPDATETTAAENGWEYVTASAHAYGTTGTTGTTGVQNIKYWDWGTNEYHFVAGSPVSSFSYTITDGEIASATVADINGHINPNTSETPMSKAPVYIAAPVKKVKGSTGETDYNTDVVFSFTRQQTYVRVGVYETIPGYKISSISFYEWDCDKSGGADWKDDPQDGHNIVLNSKTANYFKGTNATSASVTVSYDWSSTPASYTLDYASAPVSQENWYGGKLNLSASNPLATSSAEATTTYFYGTDSDIDTKGYFTVLPTPSETAGQAIIIKCDYQLTALDGTETINVKGATAAIPAAFCKWNPNTTYTYLFKISDNTNGKTDTSQPTEGLFPITFDATVIAETSGTEQGYITTVSIPSITTYQEGSVTTEGIQYVKDKNIYFTVQDNTDGGLKALNTTASTVGYVKVFWLGDFTTYPSTSPAPTEADLQVTAPSTEVGSSTPSGSTALSLPTDAWSINGQSVAKDYYGAFKPGADGYYAIQYLTTAASGSDPAAYTYKIIKVGTEPVSVPEPEPEP